VISGDLLDLRVRDLLEAIASVDPTPGGGSTAALAVAMSAALSAMVARASSDWPDAGAAIAQAEQLRKRTAPLAQRDAEVYEEALAAIRLPERAEPIVRDAAAAALSRAAEVPLLIAEAGADAASLAVLVADRGTPDRRGDAAAAALLAEAGARAAASLIALNLAVTPEDDRVAHALLLAKSASEAAREAVRSTQRA
jgi:methenyltetrahydrofolate cyclohydrolase